jgi:hypothetical protein
MKSLRLGQTLNLLKTGVAMACIQEICLYLNFRAASKPSQYGWCNYLF